ncbi:hypothetical protein BGX28_008489 [Mortierella sp. GBA30]|nr:hypothetical protein BGX28_008489 [Mortierella sp. GBA30]
MEINPPEEHQSSEGPRSSSPGHLLQPNYTRPAGSDTSNNTTATITLHATQPEYSHARYPPDYSDHQRGAPPWVHQQCVKADSRLPPVPQEHNEHQHELASTTYPPHNSGGFTYNKERLGSNRMNGSTNKHLHQDPQDDIAYEQEQEWERRWEQRIESKQHGYGNQEHENSSVGHKDGSEGSGDRTNGGHHPRIRSAPHSFSSHEQDSQPPRQQRQQQSHHATVSHHPGALNRYPFSIPSISAKLDQPHHADGSDALSSLWKKTTPIQEPYFRTRHTIASQHTLSTLGGVLFSLDEVPSEFNQDMYIAMRNRIFELEAKAVNYSPFSHSRKRSIDRTGLDEYPDRYGYDGEYAHYSKRPSHGYPLHSIRSHGYAPDDRPSSPAHQHSSSYPSWYTPEVYTSGPRHKPLHYSNSNSMRYPEYDRDHYLSDSPYFEPSSRPGSPQPAPVHAQTLRPIRPGNSPPLPGEPSIRASAHLGRPPQSYIPSASSQDARQPPGPPGEVPQGGRHSGSYTPGKYPLPQSGSSHAHPQSSHAPPPPPTQGPSHHVQPPPHHQPLPPRHADQAKHPHQHTAQGYPQASHLLQQQPQHPLQAANGHSTAAPSYAKTASAAPPEQRMSIHQQRHRAQQQAQSAHSRSYHLHKHMRMLDQQRTAQMAAQNQHQQKLQQKQAEQYEHGQQQPQRQGVQTFKPIQRHYQPHQQMYPVHNQPIAIKPHPRPPQSQLLQHQQRQPQALRPNPFHSQQGLTQQQQLLQRYQQQRHLQQKQQQLRQLQLLRSRSSAVPYPTQKSSHPAAAASLGSHSPTPPRMFGPQVDRPIKKSTRPMECSNCMALDSLAWKPKAEIQNVPLNDSTPAGSKVLCPACTQYLQTHGKPRPVGPFRTNFLKKIHTRFKRELQEVRFQGWQDAQVLEIEDRMNEREFQMVFNGLEESDTSRIASRHASVSGSPAPSTPVAASEAAETSDATSVAAPTAADLDQVEITGAQSSSTAKVIENIVIKIEDEDIEGQPLDPRCEPEKTEVRTFQSEASVGELFGHRWRTEPVVGYTLVHFGGSDRTRMVPMNPTVPSLTVTFNRSAESVTFAFRVLVNGLCLLASGGGPPALHMPEMADDDESEEEDEIVVVPDNDKEDNPSPSSPPSVSIAAGSAASVNTSSTPTPPEAQSKTTVANSTHRSSVNLTSVVDEGSESCSAGSNTNISASNTT